MNEHIPANQTSEEIEYLDYLPAGLEAQAVSCFMDAFEEKLLPLFGSREKAIRLLAPNLSHALCLTAFYHNELVGVLGIHTKDRGFLNPSFLAMLREYGLARGMYRFFGLLLIEHTVRKTEWHVEGVAVDAKMRGRGIGTALLKTFERLAREKGMQTISLEVINTNPGAKKLYERLGFGVIRHSSVWPFNHLYAFPFDSSFLMAKHVK